MTSEFFKLKDLSEQVRNDFIRGAREKLEARLAKEAVEKAERESAEVAARETTEKVVAEAATREQAEAEATLVAKASQKAVEDDEKTI